MRELRPVLAACRRPAPRRRGTGPGPVSGAGARATGMGGAEVAAVDDATAAWSNPAALAGLEGLELPGLRRRGGPEPQQSRRDADPVGAIFRTTRSSPATGRISFRSWSAASCIWPSRARPSSSRARRASSPPTRVSRSRSATFRTPASTRSSISSHVVPGGGPDNGLALQHDGPVSGGALGARGARRLRPRLPRRPGRGGRRRPLRVWRDLLRDLRRLQRKLLGQGPLGDHPRRVRGERPHDEQVHLRPRRPHQFRHREVRGRGHGLESARVLRGGRGGQPRERAAAPAGARRRRGRRPVVPDARGRRRLHQERHARARRQEPADVARRGDQDSALRPPAGGVARLRVAQPELGLLGRPRDRDPGGVRGHRGRLGPDGRLQLHESRTARPWAALRA